MAIKQERDKIAQEWIKDKGLDTAIDCLPEPCHESRKKVYDKPSIYFLYDEEEIVYIGMSSRPTIRIADHMRKGRS